VKNDPVVKDLQALRYLPDGSISFKLDFDEDWQPLPQRPKNTSKAGVSWPPMYKAPLKIERQKWLHLQELKDVMPPEYHHFYHY